jgi:hypothetical protein
MKSIYFCSSERLVNNDSSENLLVTLEGLVRNDTALLEKEVQYSVNARAVEGSA